MKRNKFTNKDVPWEQNHDEITEKRIEEIVSGMKNIHSKQCKYNFKCIEENFENVCPGKVVVGGRLFRCSKKFNSSGRYRDCGFSIRFARGYFCTCPLRLYAAKNLCK